MQIDFHHGVTYVVARLAGFSQIDAEVIAHSAQYVDDATESGEIWFDNGMLYPRISSAHKMLNYQNWNVLGNHRVWLPFHFLPGNNGEPAPANIPPLSREECVQRCICRPNSPPAQDLMKAIISRQDRSYALFRLGVASHVYVDTWAHQGFVGFQHHSNIAKDIQANDDHHEQSFKDSIVDFFKTDVGQTVSDLIGEALPLGHGTVLSYPDKPYLIWSYTDSHGRRIERNNPEAFLAAAKALYQQFRRYRDFKTEGEGVFDKTYEEPTAFQLLENKLASITDEDGEARHSKWLILAADGSFGFKDQVQYISKGQGSWKAKALLTLKDIGGNSKESPIKYPPAFLDSNWKLFHDALQAHKFFVLNELLPRYGILSG